MIFLRKDMLVKCVLPFGEISEQHGKKMLTLSRTAPGSIPNLSAMGTILSGRLQVHILKKRTQ